MEWAAIAALASAFTSAWHFCVFRNRQRKDHQEMCNHVWGETEEVALPHYGFGPRFYKQRCPACHLQRDVNADGTIYVPRNRR